MKETFTLLLLLLLCLVTTQLLEAQNASSAKVKGTVIDANTGEALIGTNIAIGGTSLGTSTDLNGEYTIPNVPIGAQTVMFRYVGYQNIDREVELTAGQTLELDIEMGPEAIMGEEVVISVQAQGQRAAINQQIASDGIVNIVSSDKIQDVPDVNAAESIGRLPGVSLERSGGEGNKVVIRGLSPQFSIIQVDGVRLTGVDLDRSVGLATISSQMLDGIELSKTLTADKDADAIGGVVNLRTRVAQKGFHYDIMARGGYNDLQRSFTDYKLAGTVSNRFFDNKFGILATGGIEHVVRSADRFSASYGKNITIEEAQLFTNTASVTEVISDWYRNNGSIVLDYKTDFMTIKLNNFYSQLVKENDLRESRFLFTNSEFRMFMNRNRPDERVRSHALSGVFNIGQTVLEAGVSYNNTSLTRHAINYEFRDIQILGNNTISENRRLFAQPSGLINEFYSNITRPDFATLHTTFRDTLFRDDISTTANLDWRIPFSLGEKVSGNIKVGFKYSNKERSSNLERIESYYHGGIGANRMEIIYKLNPDFATRNDIPGFQSAVGIPAVNFLDPDYDYGEILDGDYTLGWTAEFDKLKEVHDEAYAKSPGEMLLRMGAPSSANDYENKEEVMAGYVMAVLNIGERITLIPGVRFEQMQTQYFANFITTDPFATDGIQIGFPQEISVTDRANEFFFPSVNSKFQIKEWMDVRAAYYRSATRPDYRFLSPGLTTDQNLMNLTAFNPFLNPSLVNNYDLGVSFYTNKIGLITVGGFHKDISQLIYQLPNYRPAYFDRLKDAPDVLIESLQRPRQLYPEEFIEGTGVNTRLNNYPINNPNPATFTGFEVSTQTNFWFLPGILSGLVLDLNYSMIWSRTEFPYLDIEIEIDDSRIIPIPVEVPVYRTKESRLLDQPAALFNARIGLDYKGFSTRVSFRYQGETLQGLDPVNELLDGFSNDLFRIDLNAKQKITDQFSVSLDVINLTEFQDQSFFRPVGRVLPQRSEFYGMQAQISLRYEY